MLPLFLTASRPAQGAECTSGTCVPADDLKTFVQLAKEHKCRAEMPPTFALDPITIIVDKQGRIFGSGSDPKPFTLKATWCNYTLEGKGQTKILAAQREEPIWGWRFRLKLAVGYLPATAYYQKDGYAGLDAGLLLEPFFLSWANVNAYVGVRSVGGGLGFDLLKNFGLHLGYAVTWGTWQHNPHAAIYFAFW
jgi:hypothetical protein